MRTESQGDRHTLAEASLFRSTGSAPWFSFSFIASSLFWRFSFRPSRELYSACSDVLRWIEIVIFTPPVRQNDLYISDSHNNVRTERKKKKQRICTARFGKKSENSNEMNNKKKGAIASAIACNDSHYYYRKRSCLPTRLLFSFATQCFCSRLFSNVPRCFVGGLIYRAQCPVSSFWTLTIPGIHFMQRTPPASPLLSLVTNFLCTFMRKAQWSPGDQATTTLLPVLQFYAFFWLASPPKNFALVCTRELVFEDSSIRTLTTKQPYLPSSSREQFQGACFSCHICHSYVNCLFLEEKLEVCNVFVAMNIVFLGSA